MVSSMVSSNRPRKKNDSGLVWRVVRACCFKLYFFNFLNFLNFASLEISLDVMQLCNFFGKLEYFIFELDSSQVSHHHCNLSPGTRLLWGLRALGSWGGHCQPPLGEVGEVLGFDGAVDHLNVTTPRTEHPKHTTA